MGLMKKAAAALGFGDGGKGRKALAEAPAVEHPTAAPAGSLSAPQHEFDMTDEFRFALMSTDSASAEYTATSVATWAGRSSADGRLGVLFASQLRSIGVTLDSPGTSATGTPTGPSCTGGGHGEAPPSVLGNHPRLSTPTLRQSINNANCMLSSMCTATATPLARQVATRALRKVGDSAPVSLPSITSLTGGVRPQPIQVPPGGGGGGGAPDTGPSPPISPSATSPRPPNFGPSGYNPSPRMRRSTTLDTHAESEACQYVAVSAAVAAASAGAGTGIATSPSAISAPCTDLPGGGAGMLGCHQPYGQARERFSRLASFNFHDAPSSGGREQVSDNGGDSSPGGGAPRTGGPSTQLSNSMPLCALRMETLQIDGEASQPAQAHSGASPSPFSSAASVTNSASLAAPPGAPGGAAPPNRAAPPPPPPPPAERAAVGTPPVRQGSGSQQAALRARGLTPYTPHHNPHPQQQYGRLPPRRLSEYSMSQVQQQQERLLPKLKSVASASAANAFVSTSCKAMDAASAAVAALHPRTPPTAVAVTAVAESAAAAAAAVAAAGTAEVQALRPRRCVVANISDQVPQADSSGGDGGISSSGTSSRGGSAKASSQGGPVPPGGAAAAAAAVPSGGMEKEEETGATLPTQCAAESHSPARPPQTPSPSAKSAAIQDAQMAAPRGAARRLASPTTAFSLPASSVPSPAVAKEEAEPTSPMALAVELSAAEPVSPKQQLGPMSPLDEFVPRPSPGQGLLHFSPAAPVQMLRSPVSWGVSDFKVVRKLYAGYASSVYKACCLYSGSDVVLKAYNLAGLSTFLKNQVLRELDIHSRLRHPGVVHLMAAFREGDILLLVLEYVRGGSLDRVRRKLGGRMTEFQAMHLVLLPLLGVLTYLHERGIVHRDIKPENLLFTESWQLKLCDYGVSICLREERAVTRTGSREYMAPEVNVCPLKKGPEDNKDNPELAYSTSVDIWSLGALMYELLVGFTPFPGGPPACKEGARGSAGAALAFPSSVSQGARTFVRSCLELDPADRPTILELTQHPWIREALEYNASLQNP